MGLQGDLLRGMGCEGQVITFHFIPTPRLTGCRIQNYGSMMAIASCISTDSGNQNADLLSRFPSRHLSMRSASLFSRGSSLRKIRPNLLVRTLATAVIVDISISLQQIIRTSSTFLFPRPTNGQRPCNITLLLVTSSPGYMTVHWQGRSSVRRLFNS